MSELNSEMEMECEACQHAGSQFSEKCNTCLTQEGEGEGNTNNFKQYTSGFVYAVGLERTEYADAKEDGIICVSRATDLLCDVLSAQICDDLESIGLKGQDETNYAIPVNQWATIKPMLEGLATYSQPLQEMMSHTYGFEFSTCKPE